MNPNQYTLVKHTILPLIYRVVHPQIHQISTDQFSFYFSLPPQRPSIQLSPHVQPQFLNPQHFYQYPKTQPLRNLTWIQNQTQVCFLQWQSPNNFLQLSPYRKIIKSYHAPNSRGSQAIGRWRSFCLLYRCQRLSKSFQSHCCHAPHSVIYKNPCPFSSLVDYSVVLF